MTVTLNLATEKLRRAIRAEYAEVAVTPEKGFHFHTGRPLARMLGYPEVETDPLPDSVIESFAGVGNPFIFGRLRPSETVVEIGSGAGLDAVLAARQVGASGRVIGVDMTPAMLRKARANAEALRLGNVEFRRGYAEELPVEDASADVVISNGVINLSPDKEAVFGEVARVLKPGGSRSPASWSRRRCPTRPRRTSTSGPVESPVLCWKQSSRRSSRPTGWSTSSGAGSAGTPSRERQARPVPRPSGPKGWPSAR